MAISLHKLCLVFISLFLVFFLSSHPTLSHPLRCHPHESEALLRFKEALNDSEGYLSSWVNGTDCCTMWDGILCDNQTNHVVELFVNLYYPGVISESLFLHKLSGMIPSSICFLTRFTYLNLGWNEFNGSIPSCLANLSSLEYLYLSGNQLSGNIPISLGSLALLRSSFLGRNPLSGNIPSSLGNLSLLETLYLGDTQLSGTIPPSFAQLSSLNEFYADGNRFNESVSYLSLPTSLVALSLTLNHNQSVSETFFRNLISLRSLYLSDYVLNISKTWISFFNLTTLNVVSCMIGDEIPPWISTQISHLIH